MTMTVTSNVSQGLVRDIATSFVKRKQSLKPLWEDMITSKGLKKKYPLIDLSKISEVVAKEDDVNLVMAAILSYGYYSENFVLSIIALWFKESSLDLFPTRKFTPKTTRSGLWQLQEKQYAKAGLNTATVLMGKDSTEEIKVMTILMCNSIPQIITSAHFSWFSLRENEKYIQEAINSGSITRLSAAFLRPNNYEAYEKQVCEYIRSNIQTIFGPRFGYQFINSQPDDLLKHLKY